MSQHPWLIRCEDESTTMDDADAEKITIYEQYRREEITEKEARELLGDDVVDSMENDVEAFESSMKLDTSDLLSGK